MNIKPLFKKTQNQILKISTVVVIVLALSWGITQATSSEFEQSTKNFSVIGTVSSITEDSISLIDARGSDTKEEELYNLNIENIQTVETKDYTPLIVSDITIGSTIVAQGVTNNSTFFITRIVLFSETFEKQIEEVALDVATSTVATGTEEIIEEEVATSTEEIATSTDSETLATSTLPSATTSDPVTSTSTEEEAATSADSTIMDTVIDVIEEVIDTIVDTVDDIINPPAEGESSEEPLPSQVVPKEPVIEDPEVQVEEEGIITQ